MTDLSINPELVSGILVDFIRDEVLKVGARGVVVAISGGIDSALSAQLAVTALGAGAVTGLALPYRESTPSSLEDGQLVAAQLGIELMVIEISPQIDAYFSKFPDADPTRRGNKLARERMSVLYDISATRSALVLGTSNKSELLLGYSTLWGDGAHALNPLGDLYKTQLYQLARHLGLPQRILDKPPSADLFVGQSDEVDLGFTYEQADRILFRLIDERRSPAELAEQGLDPALVAVVWERVRSSQFKRRLPLIAKLSGRSIGQDFRYPRDWGY
ncbi:MAG TPA: NAD+ synthase [Candidatus Dormibacteraeota bacterium]|nr:NAD+ synthase [Candidatus Dormibacteraeota bacterium]